MRTYQLISIIGLLLIPAASLAQASVRAELSQTRIMIGDQVNLQVRVTQPGNAKVDIDLNPLADVDGLEIVRESDPIRKEDPGVNYLEKNIVLTSFDSGEYIVPQIPIRLIPDSGEPQTLLTNPIPLMVMTIPIVSDSLQLAPIKDIDREEFTFQDALPYLLGASGVILLALFIWWFGFRKQRLADRAAPIIIRPAHEVALDKLHQLEEEKLWQQGRIKDYYSLLTYIAREYLENRYRIPALENTTGEILQQVGSFREIDRPLLDTLRHILTASDMVKFAKAEPAATFHTEALDKTRQFIVTTQAKPEVSPETGDEAESKEPQKKTDSQS